MCLSLTGPYYSAKSDYNGGPLIKVCYYGTLLSSSAVVITLLLRAILWDAASHLIRFRLIVRSILKSLSVMIAERNQIDPLY